MMAADSFKGSTIFSSFRPRFQDQEGRLNSPRRGYHIELGAREKALLEEDPALRKFKSYKNSVKRVSKIGTVLTVFVAADPRFFFTFWKVGPPNAPCKIQGKRWKVFSGLSS